MPAAAGIRTVQALPLVTGRKGYVGGLIKLNMKVQCMLRLKGYLTLLSLEKVEVSGTVQ